MVSGACKARGGAILARAGQGARIIEVGTLRGDLASWCLSERPDLQWIMVDSWKPADQQSEAYRNTRDDHALHTPAKAEQNRRAAYHAATEVKASVLRMDRFGGVDRAVDGRFCSPELGDNFTWWVRL